MCRHVVEPGVPDVVLGATIEAAGHHATDEHDEAVQHLARGTLCADLELLCLTHCGKSLGGQGRPGENGSMREGQLALQSAMESGLEGSKRRALLPALEVHDGREFRFCVDRHDVDVMGIVGVVGGCGKARWKFRMGGQLILSAAKVVAGGCLCLFQCQWVTAVGH